MKKFLALLLTLALLAGLTACKDTEAASTAQEQHTVTAPTNDATFVYQPDDPAATLPGGESVVLVTRPRRHGIRRGCHAVAGHTDVRQHVRLYRRRPDCRGQHHRRGRGRPARCRRAAQSSWSAAATPWARRSTACRKTTLTSTTCCLIASLTATTIALTIRPALSIASFSRRNRPGIWPGTPL